MKTWRDMDRSKWRKGPWDEEPDSADWVDDYTQFPCVIRRNDLGALCGYVSVEPDSRFYGKGYNDVDVAVHGGLTYAEKEQPGNSAHRNRPSGKLTGDEKKATEIVDTIAGMVSSWWLGFDCAHAFDDLPGIATAMPHSEYRDFEYVHREVTHLAKQLAGVA